MRSIYDKGVVESLQQRLAQLRADTRPRWGKFTAPQMLAHVNDQMRMTLGELPVKFRDRPFQYTPLKQLIIYVLPFPKGAPTAPELIARIDVAEFNRERESFATLARRVAASRGSRFPLHPAFGTLSPTAWGVLGYKHTDHHFRQFGV